MNINKYPLAFPGSRKEYPGMTLLDWFAGQAMQGIIPEQIKALNGQINPFQIGMLAYAIALGMLQAREMPENAFIAKEKEAGAEVEELMKAVDADLAKDKPKIVTP